MSAATGQLALSQEAQLRLREIVVQLTSAWIAERGGLGVGVSTNQANANSEARADLESYFFNGYQRGVQDRNYLASEENRRRRLENDERRLRGDRSVPTATQEAAFVEGARLGALDSVVQAQPRPNLPPAILTPVPAGRSLWRALFTLSVIVLPATIPLLLNRMRGRAASRGRNR